MAFQQFTNFFLEREFFGGVQLDRQQVREGLAHTYITTLNGVLFTHKRPPFQGESGTAGLPSTWAILWTLIGGRKIQMASLC